MTNQEKNWNIYITPKDTPGTADNIEEDTIREQEIIRKPHKKLSLFAVMMVLLVVSVIATAGFLLNRTEHATTIKEPFITQAFINSAWEIMPESINTQIYPGESEVFYLKISNNASADLGAIIEIQGETQDISHIVTCKPNEKASYRQSGKLIYLKVNALNSSVIGIETKVPGNATPGVVSWNTTTYRNNLETENYTTNCV